MQAKDLDAYEQRMIKGHRQRSSSYEETLLYAIFDPEYMNVVKRQAELAVMEGDAPGGGR